MADNKTLNVALVGNPNSGKSSLFNQLTGLNQKIGNFPGVTVEKKEGYCNLNGTAKIKVIDLPGTYSIYPKSEDEKVVLATLGNPRTENRPDVVVVVVDASNIKRNLLLFTQIHDLGIPVILALNMEDILKRRGMKVDIEKMSKALGVKVIPMNARSGKGVKALKEALLIKNHHPAGLIFNPADHIPDTIQQVNQHFDTHQNYLAYQLLQQFDAFRKLSEEDKHILQQLAGNADFDSSSLQKKEILERYKFIEGVIQDSIVKEELSLSKNLSKQFDKILLHKFWGYGIFFMLLFFIFQAIFAWATMPMDFIDESFSSLSNLVQNALPSGAFTSLLADGILPGIGGILIFIPQIAILFAFIAVLEESGYMARVVFLMDKIMSKFGLNGKSVVPLISGVACAIPAIMAARTIGNWKERLITIFVTPLMSCSARLPVYAILIALVVPDKTFMGIFNLQGIALMSMYLLGFVAALASALAMKIFLKTKEKSYLVMEMPSYKMPRWGNVGLTIAEKSKAFVFEAGKVIFAISIILWVLASYGPGEKMENAEKYVLESLQGEQVSQEILDRKVSAFKLENSYAGILGKTIEPLIKPLGYDWKIGIALITSFAAREVFVGTIATIYSMGDTEDENTIKERMKTEINPDTGGPRFTPAVGFSLMVFYAFAMQCMSTLAIVYRETKGWKWPLLQLGYMTALAYLSAFLVYQFLF